MSAAQFRTMVNEECGLLGISQTSADVRDLLKRETTDSRAREAIAIFCYQEKNRSVHIAAALSGLDTLVFAGGIGENSAAMRRRICDGLSFSAWNSMRCAMPAMPCISTAAASRCA